LGAVSPFLVASERCRNQTFFLQKLVLLALGIEVRQPLLPVIEHRLERWLGCCAVSSSTFDGCAANRRAEDADGHAELLVQIGAKK